MVITATEVTELADRSVTQLEGTLVSLPAGGVLGTWTVRAASGEETAFGVESSAVVDTRSAPAVPGMWVRAALEDSGSGRWTALSVQTDWPPG
jgi:hypothetical protein